MKYLFSNVKELRSATIINWAKTGRESNNLSISPLTDWRKMKYVIVLAALFACVLSKLAAKFANYLNFI